jgi:hypothetical protein
MGIETAAMLALMAATTAVSVDQSNQQVKAQDAAAERQADLTNKQLAADQAEQDRLAKRATAGNVAAAEADRRRRGESASASASQSLLTGDAAGLATSLLS